MKTGIYVITVNRIGKPDKYYVGQAVDFSARESQHFRALRAGRHDNVHMQRGFDKYGEEAFSFSIVLVCDEATLTLYEQAILDFYRATYGDSSLMNVMMDCVRSHVGVKRRPETLVLMSLSQKGRKKTPEQVEKNRAAISKAYADHPEIKGKISVALKGKKRKKPHPNSLKALSDAKTSSYRIAKIQEGKRKSLYKPTDETKAKIASTLTGRKNSPESNAKRSAALRGRKLRERFYQHSDETKAKIAASVAAFWKTRHQQNAE